LEGTVSNKIVYDHPLNERIRTVLRLEHLFDRISFFMPQSEAWATRAAISGFLDILSITARSDIKTEILKELDRHAAMLERIGKQPGVNSRALSRVLEELEEVAEKVYQLGGQIAQPLRENGFIKSIMQRSSIPGGTCSFDLPQLHHWLIQPHPLRQRQMQAWMRDLEPIRDAVALLLSFARGSSDPQPATAPDGFYQNTLDSQAPVQMIRVELDADLALFPEISGHRNRFSIRFMEALETERPTQTRQDVNFTLTCCVF
jgi:cell division protein ZapD